MFLNSFYGCTQPNSDLLAQCVPLFPELGGYLWLVMIGSRMLFDFKLCSAKIMFYSLILWIDFFVLDFEIFVLYDKWGIQKVFNKLGAKLSGHWQAKQYGLLLSWWLNDDIIFFSFFFFFLFWCLFCFLSSAESSYKKLLAFSVNDGWNSC